MSHALELQIKSIEAQLSRLKARVASSREKGSGKSFRDLYGILEGKACTSEERIEEILFGRDLEKEVDDHAA